MLSFPDWETLPYDIFSPHQDLVSERLEALYRLFTRRGRRGRAPTDALDVLVLSATSALGRLAPAQFIAAHTFFFRQGEAIDAEALRSRWRWPGTSTSPRLWPRANTPCAAG